MTTIQDACINTTSGYGQLPDVECWRFDEIATEDWERATLLESAGEPAQLETALVRVLVENVAGGSVRLGWEACSERQRGSRAVVQFQVAPSLFDWFLNGRTGYRAHFRGSPELGLNFNARLIRRLVKVLRDSLPQTLQVRILNAQFDDCGTEEVSRSDLLESLDPDLSKIWFCTRLLCAARGIRDLPVGATGSKILLGEDGTKWAAPSREHHDSWLDVKGAFLGPSGLHQPKDPNDRASTLHEKGEA